MYLMRVNKSTLTSALPLPLLAAAATVLFFSPTIRDSQAAFELNFNPNTTSGHSYTSTGSDINYSCGMSFGSDFNCSSGGWGSDFDENGSHDDGSAAYQRIFTTGGKTYYHVIIGDSATDTFYTEYMVEASTSWVRYNNDFAGSASDGNNSSNANRLYNMSKPYDPDSSRTGTGSANPNRVVMRMILDDGITYNEFLKDEFDRKPLITQSMNDPSNGGISINYSVDMRGKTYTDATPIDPNLMVNQMTLSGPTMGTEGDFDSTGVISTPANYSQEGRDVTAAAFTYTTGSDYGGSNGAWTYYEADGTTVNGTGFQPTNKDYSVFCIQEQNVDWSGNGACTDGDGGGGGRGGGGWGGW